MQRRNKAQEKCMCSKIFIYQDSDLEQPCVKATDRKIYIEQSFVHSLREFDVAKTKPTLGCLKNFSVSVKLAAARTTIHVANEFPFHYGTGDEPVHNLVRRIKAILANRSRVSGVGQVLRDDSTVTTDQSAFVSRIGSMSDCMQRQFCECKGTRLMCRFEL